MINPASKVGPRVVVVDDDLATTTTLIKLSFRRNDMLQEFEDLEFIWRTNKHEFEAVLKERPVDLVISDLKLIGSDGKEDKALGYDVVACARRNTNAAIIVYSSQPSEADEATTLQEGADDYVEKNISPHRIALRIKYWLARSTEESVEHNSKKFLIGEWIFSPGDLYLKPTIANKTGPKLSYAEHDLLNFLCGTDSRSISRKDYNTHILKNDESEYVLDRRLDNQIRRLRSKLDNAGLIQSIRGGGYRLSDIQEV